MPSNTFLGQPVDMSDYITESTNRSKKYSDIGDTIYGQGQEQAKKNTALTDQVTGRALDTSKTFMDWANKDRGMYDRTYVPAMEEQMNFARNYNTPGRAAANRAGAMSGVSMGFDAGADMARRNLMGYGIDPSSGRYAGLDSALMAKRAASGAAAGTKSDRDTEMMGQSLLANAIRTGQVLPGQASNEAGVSLAANNQAVNAGLATGQANRELSQPTGWISASDNMHKEWKDAMLEQTKLGMIQNQQAAENALKQAQIDAGGSSGIGAIAGGLLGAASRFAPMLGGMMGSGTAGGAGTIQNAQVGGTGGVQGEKWGMERGGAVNDMVTRGRPQAFSPTYRMGGMVSGDNPNIHRGPVSEDDQMRGQWPPHQDDIYDDTEPSVPRHMDEGDEMSPEAEPQRMRGRRMPRLEAGGELGEETGYDDSWDEWTNKSGNMIPYDPTGGYLGFATDAADIFGDAGGGADHDKVSGDKLGIFPDSEYDQGEQLGGSIGSMGGRIIGSIWGMPGAGAAAGRDLGAGVGAMVQGRIGEGFENIGRAVVNRGVGMLEQGSGMLGGMAGGEGDGGSKQALPVRDDPMGESMMGSLYAAEGGEIPGDDEFEDPMMGGDELDDGLTSEVGDDMYSSRVVPPEASPSGGAETDDVHALVNEGEFIIPKDVTNWLGEKFFQKLIEKAYVEMQGPKVAEPEMAPATEAMQTSAPSFQSMGG